MYFVDSLHEFQTVAFISQVLFQECLPGPRTVKVKLPSFCTVLQHVAFKTKDNLKACFKNPLEKLLMKEA